MGTRVCKLMLGGDCQLGTIYTTLFCTGWGAGDDEQTFFLWVLSYFLFPKTEFKSSKVIKLLP